MNSQHPKTYMESIKAMNPMEMPFILVVLYVGVFSHDHPVLIFIVIQNVRGWETGRSTFLAL